MSSVLDIDSKQTLDSRFKNYNCDVYNVSMAIYVN